MPESRMRHVEGRVLAAKLRLRGPGNVRGNALLRLVPTFCAIGLALPRARSRSAVRCRRRRPLSAPRLRTAGTMTAKTRSPAALCFTATRASRTRSRFASAAVIGAGAVFVWRAPHLFAVVRCAECGRSVWVRWPERWGQYCACGVRNAGSCRYWFPRWSYGRSRSRLQTVKKSSA